MLSEEVAYDFVSCLSVFVDKQLQKLIMRMILVPLFLSPLLLLEEIIVPVTSRLSSVEVISYNKLRKTKNGQVMCALDLANETTSSSSEQDCSLRCGRDATCTGFNITNSLTHL